MARIVIDIPDDVFHKMFSAMAVGEQIINEYDIQEEEGNESSIATFTGSDRVH